MGAEIRPCKGCRKEFEVEIGRGRPRAFCERCRPRSYRCDLCGEPCTKQRASKCNSCRFRLDKKAKVDLLAGVECLWCEKPAQVSGLLIPESRGGQREDSNVTPACRSCAGSKGSMLPSEWAVASKRGAKAIEMATEKIPRIQREALVLTPLDYGIEPLTWWVEDGDGLVEEPIVSGRSGVV